MVPGRPARRLLLIAATCALLLLLPPAPAAATTSFQGSPLVTTLDTDSDGRPDAAHIDQEVLVSKVSLGVIGASSFTADVGTSAYESFALEYGVGPNADSAGLAYRSNTGTSSVSSPKTRTWDGSAWGGEAEQATAGGPIRAVRMAWSPAVAGMRIVVTLSDDGWLDAYVCTPTCTVTNNIGQVWSAAPTTPQRRFDVAFEQATGDALLVYGVLSTDPTRDIAYRTFVAGTWSAEQYLDDTGHGTDIQYSLVELAVRQGSDRIGLIGADDTNNHVNAWIWDGNGWGSNTEVTASAQNPNRDQIGIAWESNSGDLLAVTVSAGTTNLVYKEFTTGWGAAGTFQCGDVTPLDWMSLEPNPLGTANDMLLAVGYGQFGLSTCYWTGTGWAYWNIQDNVLDSSFSRAFDFAWEGSGSNGLLVWGTTAGLITYRTFTAPNVWGPITNVTMGANIHPWVRLGTNLAPGPGEPKIVGAVLEGNVNDLGAIRWDGASFSVTLTGSLFPPSANPNTSWSGWVDRRFDTQTIACGSATGCVLSMRVDLGAPTAGPRGNYTVVLNLTSSDTVAGPKTISIRVPLEPRGPGAPPSVPSGAEGAMIVVAAVASVAGGVATAWWLRRRPTKVEVKAGKGYFAESFQREAAFSVIEPFIRRGYATLVVSRVHPDEIRSMLPYEVVNPVWLVDYSDDAPKKVDAVPPSLEKLFARASAFLESSLRTAVAVDGLEFLIDNSNFSSVMRFLRRLIDIVAQRDSLLLVVVAPNALGPKERSNLARELTEIPV